ncbi:hypothetical protein KKC88_04850 [Patescibacteria group bacterium]|nr:hypothetical protein [Patescibacteria group bacterium]MBU1673229.1 hypothetical protein [Patescibacteria group bacterium]MBU1964013.1 hypothetical protein [Patescibacteria group bacterium]
MRPENRTPFEKYQLAVKIILRVILCILVLILLNNFLLFTGQVTYRQDYSREFNNVSTVKPPENLETSVDGDFQVMFKDQAYISVIPPHRPQSVDMEIDIQNPVPVFNLAMPLSNDGFDNRMVYNQALEEINSSSEWSNIIDEDSGVTLWQKNIQYNSLEEFNSNLGYQNTYFAVNNFQFVDFPNYFAQEDYETYLIPLRGSHSIFTYIGPGEELAWRFHCKDLGKTPGIEPFEIILFSGNSIIEKTTYELYDFKNTVEYVKKDLAAGIYEIKIPMANDTRLMSFDTKQKYLGLTSKIDMDDQNTNTTFYIIGNNLEYETVHVEGKQTLYLNDQAVEIRKKREKYEHNIFPTYFNKLAIAKNDITIQTDGVAVVNRESRLFAEYLFHLLENRNHPPQLSEVNLVMTTNQYDQPEIRGENVTLKSNFDLSEFRLTKNDKVKFSIVAPHIRPLETMMKFTGTKATFYRPLLPYIKNLFTQ